MSTAPVPVTDIPFHRTAARMYDDIAKVVSRYRGKGVGTYVWFKYQPTAEQAIVEVKIYPDDEVIHA